MEGVNMYLNNLDKCNCTGEPNCECYEPFFLRKGEQNKVKFLYLSAVLLIVAGAFVITIASIINLAWLFFVSIFVSLILFIGAYVIASSVPKKYRDAVCTEFKFFYRDFGMLRWTRRYILLFDIVIASFPLTVFIWDISHTAIELSNGARLGDPVPLMYIWKFPGWTILTQGWLDFTFCAMGIILIIIEFVIWIDIRKGEMCSMNFDDLPFPIVGEYDGRISKTKGDWWNDFFEGLFKPFVPKKAKENKSI